MKNNFKIATIALSLLISLAGFPSCGPAKTISNTAAAAEFSKPIDSSNWVFNVLLVRPQRGGNRQPNGAYSVSYKPGNLNVYLPYFGTANSGADVYSGENALNFISKDFTVEKEELKEGKWRVVIKPSDHRQVQSMTFIIFSNGSASLDIIMTSRSAISYSGAVSQGK